MGPGPDRSPYLAMRVTRRNSRCHNNKLGRAGVAHLRALHLSIERLVELEYVPPATHALPADYA